MSYDFDFICLVDIHEEHFKRKYNLVIIVYHWILADESCIVRNN